MGEYRSADRLQENSLIPNTLGGLTRTGRTSHFWIALMLLAVLLLASCAPATSAPALQPTTVPSATSAPTATPRPSPTPNPFPNPVLKITGEEEVVFDWTTDRCEPENIPDLATRAFRDATGLVHLLISHYVDYQMTGPDLNQLTPDCIRLMISDYDRDPSMYNDSEWIASPYTEDGKTVYALVHNEYRGHTHPGQCPSGDYFDCLDTSITLAVSRDSGATFADVSEPPGHLVATLPHQWMAGAGPFGIRNPSNIIKGKDGLYYAFSNVSQYDTQRQWVCLMRSDDLSDPASWRYWDGTGFDGRFINPYVETASGLFANVCGELALDQIGASLNDSITYNTYLGRYVLVGLSADQVGGRELWGIYYSFSDDLIHWSHRKPLAEMPLPWTVGNPGADLSILYPALLDPASDSRNFETTGKTAYLYYTRMNRGAGSLDRDLIRIPVEFLPKP